MNFYLCAIPHKFQLFHTFIFLCSNNIHFINHTLKLKYPPLQVRVKANDQERYVAACSLFAKNSTGRLRVDEAEECATSGQTVYRGVIQEAESHKTIDEDGALLRLNPKVTV
jgi:hypothetical protein